MTGRFAVIWKRELIERQLAELVTSLAEAGQSMYPVTHAMAEIDRRLARDPLNEGESRSSFARVLIVSPLTVLYEVHEDENVVYVESARYSPERPRS